MSSEESNISEKLKILAPKQNSFGVQRLRRKRSTRTPNVYKIQTQSPVSRRKQRKIPMRFAFVPANTLRGNHFTTPSRLPITKQGVPGVLPMRGLRNGQFEIVSRHENQSSTFHSKSSKFHTSPKPPCYTSVALNDLTYHFYNIEGCNHNTFHSGQRISCCPSILSSNQETSFSTHKLVSDCIRNSRFPINTNISPASSITPFRDRIYFQQSSSNSTNSTPKDHSTSEERGTTRNTSKNISPSSFYHHPTFRKIPIGSHFTSSPILTKPCSILKLPFALEKIGLSPCLTLTEVGSMESNLENTTSSSSTAEPCSLSESSIHSSEQMYEVRRSSSESLNSGKESWDTGGSTSNINQSFMSLNSFTRLKSLSEENGLNNTPQKNGYFSNSIICPIKRQCPSQLQTDASPSNTSTTPVHKNNENVSGSSRLPHSPILYHQPVVTSADFKVTNLSFQENVRKYTTLDNNDSMMMSPICPEEQLQQDVGESISTLNPSESQKSSKEKHSTANIFANERQSLASLSMTHGSPTTDSSELAITPNGTNSEQSANNKNKTRKKFKLFSCFTSCFHLSSPQKDQT